MWRFASKAIAGSVGPRNGSVKRSQTSPDSSDDEASLSAGREEGLECPICFESFNIVENVPYVLWCGHTICKNCVLSLQWAVVKFPNLPVQLPLFISCPWCHLLSFRLVYKGCLKFPRKNYFLLWLVEGMNGERATSYSTYVVDQQSAHSSLATVSDSCHHRPKPRMTLRNTDMDHPHLEPNHLSTIDNGERGQSFLRKSVFFFFQLTARFPFVIIFLLIALYAVPASAAILALYVLVTLLFGLPSFLILYFAYPSLDWLFKEIVT